ncbi:hypothetical protein FKM82_002217 [Ascaphus truei]
MWEKKEEVFIFSALHSRRTHTKLKSRCKRVPNKPVLPMNTNQLRTTRHPTQWRCIPKNTMGVLFLLKTCGCI